MRESILNISLTLHVLAGILSLFFGLIAMTTRKKGGKLHNQSGLIFYWSIAFIFLTAIIFVVLYPTKDIYHFFLAIGIVSFYPSFSGKRLLAMKKGLEPLWYDWLAVGIIILSGFVMITSGVNMILQSNSGISILYLVFGIFSLVQGIGDFLYFSKKRSTKKMHWFFGHAGKMIGAYSAAVTAFCVNIVPRYLPDGTPMFIFILIWVGPGIVFAFITKYLVKKYKAKFKLA
jgi:hypothetical protein